MERDVPGLAPVILRRLFNQWLSLRAPRMRYGTRSGGGQWRAHSRISTHTVIECPGRMDLGDHVYIGHFNFIDASGGLVIEDGVQVTNHVSVLTHSTHQALRIERERFWGNEKPAGLQRAPTHIGEWSFIGPHCTIAPGSRLGRGVLVRSHSYVNGQVPDFAIVQGQPARVIGDVRDADRSLLAALPADFRLRYEAWLAGAGGNRE
jgi:acetyltransferase-like isoleucine patch superfamily enzyme